MRKDNGFTRDVFRTRHMLQLKGNMGVGHVRYPTAGASSSAEAQPFYVNSPYGIVLAHNGNLTNAEELKREVFLDDLRHINTESDSEILLNVFAHELQVQNKLRIDEEDIFRAVEGVHRRCRGGYAAVAMIPGFGVFGFRDPHGIRPIVYGKRETDAGTEYMIASESVALDTLGFELIADVAPRAHRRRGARGVRSDQLGRRAVHPAVRGTAGALAVHLRVRLLRAAGFHHRQHLRAQGALAHGQEAGGQDQAHLAGA
jgi:amidophosphoribosyltransferase